MNGSHDFHCLILFIDYEGIGFEIKGKAVNKKEFVYYTSDLPTRSKVHFNLKIVVCNSDKSL